MKAPRPTSVSVRVPGSSANLGVGYDVLALALGIHLEVGVEPAGGSDSRLSVEGEGADTLRWDESNRFRRGLGAAASEAGADLPALHVTVRNEIPLARGLGSSAAATVAGLLVGRELFGAPATAERLLELASEIEGHPENAAASLHGGFVVCAAGRVVRYDPPPELRAVAFIPDRELPTADMRAVLPATVEHADAVHNLGRAALVVSAFATGNLALLEAMFDDRLHEPYRATVYPELRNLVGAAREAGALGAALSGAGSSVIALCTADAVARISQAFESAAKSAGLAGRARQLEVA
jgi:homoserine kinase